MRRADGATIRDVARLAGVSVQTVSRVLNERPDVAAETRARVQRAVAELRFVPSAAARALSGVRRPMIGVLTHTRFASNAFFSRVVEGAALEAISRGCAPLIAPTDGSAEGARAAIDLLLAHRVDGVVLAQPQDLYTRDLRKELRRLTAPLVGVGSFRDPGRRIPTIAVDHRGGARMATRHLLQLGHRRIVLLRGPLLHVGADERVTGHREALEEAGLEPETPSAIADGWDFEAGVRAMGELVGRGSDFSAVVVHQDQLAIGAIAALAQMGRQVPRDVAVIGYGDLPVAAFIRPALTTVHWPADQLGARAVQRIVAGSARSPLLERLPAALVVRESCGERLWSPAAEPPVRDEMGELVATPVGSIARGR